MRLKARARLGEEATGDGAPRCGWMPPTRRRPTASARCRRERDRDPRRRRRPVRRRLSWLSPLTGLALYVNARGQRIAEGTVNALAHDLATGRARIVTAGEGRLVDRAWRARWQRCRARRARRNEQPRRRIAPQPPPPRRRTRRCHRRDDGPCARPARQHLRQRPALLASGPLHDDCLYQLRFMLQDRAGQRVPFEIGAHLLWQNAAAAPGQAWMGFPLPLTRGRPARSPARVDRRARRDLRLTRATGFGTSPRARAGAARTLRVVDADVARAWMIASVSTHSATTCMPRWWPMSVTARTIRVAHRIAGQVLHEAAVDLDHVDRQVLG